MAEDENGNQPPRNDTPPPADQQPPTDQNPPPTDDVAAQLATAQADLASSITDYREAATAANPDLPEATFAGESIADIKSSVATARGVLDHVAANAPPPPKKPPAVAGTARTPAAAPAGLRGTALIAHALKNPGSGNTE